MSRLDPRFAASGPAASTGSAASALADLVPAIAEADRRVRPLVLETPLERAPRLSELAGRELYLKLENQQRTGSFKLRGATNALLSLDAAGRARGVVAASSGNHGAAVAWASRELGVRALVFVPETAPATKVDAIRRAGAEVRVHGADSLDTEVAARAFAAAEGRLYLSPYNDARVVAGQGTVGIEIARQLDRVDELWIAVGGGGLLAGTATWLRSVHPHLRVVGCSPRHSSVMASSVAAGEILELPSLPTLSDGTAGGVEPGAITFAACRDLVDEWVLVEEDAIAAAIRLMVAEHHMIVEGAAAVAIAAAVHSGSRPAPGARAVVAVCGANLDADRLRRVLDGGVA